MREQKILRSLKKKSEFKEVFGEGKAYSNQLATIFVRRVPQLSSRVGFVVSRKLGKAVVRNRIKRIFREAIRMMGAKLKDGWEMVVMPKVGTEKKKMQEIMRGLQDLFQRAEIL